MWDSIRARIWPAAVLVLLAGSALALTWWDWLYPGRLVAWWNGEQVYPFFWRQLGGMIISFVGACLALWLASARVIRTGSRELGRAARPFGLGLLALIFFARFKFHPLGVQIGSSVWVYGLLVVSAAVVAIPLASLFPQQDHKQGHRRGWRVVFAAAIVYAIVFGFLTVARHDSFRSHALDLGAMDQAAWNTSQGRVLERTPLYRAPADGSRYENRLLDAKLELIFLPLSALYWLWSDPRTLLIVQALCLGAGALPLYGLLYERIGSARVASMVAVAYLLYIPLHFVNMADFHASALTIPAFLAAWWAMSRNRWKAYYVWLFLALCCRIDAAFVALALGASIAVWNQGHRKHGIATILVAAAWLAGDFFVVVPAVQRAYGPEAGSLVARRFEALGGDASSVVRTLLTKPLFVLSMLADREKLQTVFDLLAPLGFLPLLSLPALLPALPVLLINLLAGSSWQNSVHAHYMAPVIPFLWIATGEGLAWVHRRAGARWRLRLGLLILISATLTAVILSPYPPGFQFRLSDFYQPSPYVEDLRHIAAIVPEQATLCAQSDIYPHLSQRRDASLFPFCRLDKELETEYVILDMDAAATKSPLDFHAFYQMVDLWLTRPDYGVVASRGGVVLLKQGAPREDVPQTLSDLDAFGRAFYRTAYKRVDLPSDLHARDIYRVSVVLRNTGSQCWVSGGQLPVRLAYRWWTAEGALLAVEPLRTDLPHRVEPGQTVRLRAWLRTPPNPGRYELEWDMLREGDAWFGDMGATMLRQAVTVY